MSLDIIAKILTLKIVMEYSKNASNSLVLWMRAIAIFSPRIIKTCAIVKLIPLCTNAIAESAIAIAHIGI